MLAAHWIEEAESFGADGVMGSRWRPASGHEAQVSFQRYGAMRARSCRVLHSPIGALRNGLQ